MICPRLADPNEGVSRRNPPPHERVKVPLPHPMLQRTSGSPLLCCSPRGLHPPHTRPRRAAGAASKVGTVHYWFSHWRQSGNSTLCAKLRFGFNTKLCICGCCRRLCGCCRRLLVSFLSNHAILFSGKSIWKIQPVVCLRDKPIISS